MKGVIIMSITNEEKELLFKEFVERINNGKKPQGYASCAETLFNLKPAYNHFKDRFEALHKLVDDFEWNCQFLKVTYSDWDKIRIMVCHAFGVTIVKNIPEEKLPEANELAIKITDALFDINEKSFEEWKINRLKELSEES